MGKSARKEEVSTNTGIRFENRSETAGLAGPYLAHLVKNSSRTVFLGTMVLFCCFSPAFAQNDAGPALRIDIPTTLEKTDVVIDFGHAVFNGDMPFALGDINLLAHDARGWNAKGTIVVIFHGDAAYMVLNDDTYNTNRHLTIGNPYRKLLAALMDQGVQLELCGATAKGNHWGNANLLPGIKVNLNAMVRLTQLEQEGYTMIYE